MLMIAALLLLTITIGFLVSWAVYYFGGNFVVFEGVSKIDGLKLAGIESFYIIIIAIFRILPLGSIIAGLLSLALPFIMIKAIQKQYDTGLPIAIMVYIVATVGKLIIFIPFLTTY